MHTTRPAGFQSGHDLTRAPVLEVEQRWGEVLLDTRHYAPDGPPVTVGNGVSWHWSVLGVRMGMVPSPLHRLAAFAPPLWSDVEALPSDDFHAPDDALPAGLAHPLVSWDDGDWVLEAWSTWPVTVRLSGDEVSLDALAAEGRATITPHGVRVPVIPGVEVSVTLGKLRFDVRLVPDAARVLTRADVRDDAPFFGMLSLTAFVGLMLAVFLWAQPPPPQAAMVELPDRFVSLMLAAEPETPKAPTPKGDSATQPGPKSPESKPEANQEPKRREDRKGGRDAVTVKDHEVASQAGIFGRAAESGLDALAGTGLNSELTGAIDGMNGPRRAGFGGGLGDRGPCCGHGGTADMGDGTRVGTLGVGGGDKDFGTPDGTGKTDGDFDTMGEGIILGGLDRAEVDEVVKRHLQRIRYCYQREYQKDPTLGGTVKVKFVIAKDGTVSSAEVSSSSLGSAGAEGCISGRFMEMQFPKPRGNGIVIVSYPFHFAGGH